jgi:hypothetical protein
MDERWRDRSKVVVRLRFEGRWGTREWVLPSTILFYKGVAWGV